MIGAYAQGMAWKDSSAGRRLEQCRAGQRSWDVPTVHGSPAPPSGTHKAARARPRESALDPAASRSAAPFAPRGRLHDDCVLIPQFHEAEAFVEVRQGARVHGSRRAFAHLETPVVLALLMTFLPPLAVAIVWSSTQLTRVAQIALTLYGVVTTVAAAAIALRILRG